MKSVLVNTVVVLFGFLLLAATPNTKPIPSYKEAIDKAQRQVLEKQRTSASEILTAALKKEKKESVAFKELSKALEAISEIFINEKTQQLFELGRSLSVSDLPSAIGQYKESLRLEPDNALVLKTLARAYLALADCERVLTTSEEGLKVNTVSKELALLKIQALACLHRSDELKLYLSSVEGNLSGLALFVELAKSQALYFDEKYDLALATAERAKLLDPEFPEAYYWLGQIQMKSGKDDALYSRIYVQMCQETSKIKKKYELEPRLCLESKNVEKDLEARPQKISKPNTKAGAA